MRRSKTRKSWRALRRAFRRAGLMAATAAAAAISAPLAGGVAAQNLVPWRHGIIEAKSDAGILFMASKRDFAEKHGLKLDFVQLKNDAIALKAMLAGELDSYEGGTGGALVAATRGADVRIVGCDWLGVPHGVYVRPPIATMAELKGKSVAVSTPGSFPELFARVAFERAGIAIADVKFAAMGSDTDRYKALIAGVVDGAIISNEFEPIAKDRIRNLMPAAEAMPDFVRLCIQMTGKTLAQRRGNAATFLASEIEGLRYAMSHRDETVALTRAITGAKADDPRPAFVFDEAVRTKVVATELPIPTNKLDYVQKQLIVTGILARPIEPEKIVDRNLREQALALLAN